jgi:hypothetical protein
MPATKKQIADAAKIASDAQTNLDALQARKASAQATLADLNTKIGLAQTARDDAITALTTVVNQP